MSEYNFSNCMPSSSFLPLSQHHATLQLVQILLMLKLLNQYHWIQCDSSHFHQLPQSLTESGNSAWLDKSTMVIEDITGIINYPISSTCSTNAATEAAAHSCLLNTTQSVSSIFSIFHPTRTFSVTCSLSSITSMDSFRIMTCQIWEIFHLFICWYSS